MVGQEDIVLLYPRYLLIFQMMKKIELGLT